MAFEPINIFSRKIDPRGVAKLLRGASKKVDVQGPDDDWKEIVVHFPGGFLRRGKTLQFSHDAEYYDGDDWSQQVFGMRNYFAGFAPVARTAEILRTILSFRFALAVPQHDLDIHSRDERLKLVYAVCQHLDGVIFTPSALRDAHGRILISASGDSDSRAVLPFTPVTLQEDDVDDDEDSEVVRIPPTPERVARRALVLTMVANRGLLESESKGDPKAKEFCRYMEELIQELGVSDELEPNEWEVLQRPLGTLSQQQMIDAIWRIEGLGVLAWALGRYDLPSDDELVNPPDLFDVVGGFDEEATRTFLHTSKLRTTDEIEQQRQHFLMLHWRMRDFSIRPEPCDFVALSKKCWFGTFSLAGFRILENDVAIGDVPIFRADPEDISRCASLASERHLAINWLAGDSETYSETDTST